jgi:hypothetical protein
MAVYISPNNEYPRHIGDLVIEHPDFQDGDEIPNGWKLVLPTEMPVAEVGYVVYEIDPIQVNGIYYQSWATRILSENEIKSNQVLAVKRKVMMKLPLTEAEELLLGI